MSATARNEPAPPGPRACVERALADAREANALAVAWLRVAARAFLAALFAAGLVLGLKTIGLDLGTSLTISTSHLAVGLLVLFLLRRRRSEWVIALGAASDFAALVAGAWLGVERSPANPELVAGSFMGVFALVLLLSALTLPARVIAPLAAVSCVVEALVLRRSDLPALEVIAIAAALVVFAVAITLVGNRLVAMTARAASAIFSGEQARRHADDMRRVNDDLRAAQERTETLTALIVHDLRNPLASVSANLEAVRAELNDPTEACADALDVATEELQRVTDMIRDLLLVSRIEEGLHADPRPTAVEPLLRNVARGMERVVERTGAELAVQAPRTVTAALDESMVRRLVENLLANAARHVGVGDRIELAGEVEDGRLRLAVRNSGPPIPLESRDRIFAKHATEGRREWHNAGLGLYLCRLVAEEHGGTIALADRPGWNVSFEVELPLA